MRSGVGSLGSLASCLVEALRETVDAKVFANSSFKVTIARCQQAALEQAKMSVPDPARQLELLSAKRTKSQRTKAALKLSLIKHDEEHHGAVYANSE